jgi:putative SbcD/Mre11-related phosphoesterase
MKTQPLPLIPELGKHDGPALEAWTFSPVGAAICQAERTAVIADVHLGYEWARGSAGDCVPAHSLAETVAKLGLFLARATITRLVVAGDLVESSHPCRRTFADLARLVRWLRGRGVDLVVLEGNHDRAVASSELRNVASGDGRRFDLGSQLEVAGWTIAHGHRATRAAHLISGHYHPVLRVSGHSAPCFLVGEKRIILPAFSANAAGLDVATARLPASWRSAGLRCLVSTGLGLLDFGPLEKLSARLGSRARQS